MKQKYTPSLYWAIPEKIQTGGLRIWNFQGYQRNSMWNFRGWPRKNYVEFPGVLVFGLGISKGDDFQGRCYTVLHNFQGWSFDLSRISRGKVNKRKTPGGGSKQYIFKPFPHISLFLWNSSLYLTFWRYFLQYIICKMQSLDLLFLVVLH